MFERLLIANRGEIACRIMRTARRMGLHTIAVYSDADAEALHVAMADEAHRIGTAEPARSYLDVEAVIAAARAAGADALHPGYGFLAENAELAEACAAAGIAFVGPPPEAIRVMGSKSAAKALMEEAGVAVLPGYHGEAQDDATLRAAAESVGFPLLIKPAAGGGGKGMRLVRAAAELETELAAARREARGAFGDDTLLIERYLERPRHVEVQILADTHGRILHLFERDCSLQRRHQKIIEEAPAPGLPEALRTRMGEAAVRAAASVGYVGAGTVEFLYDPEEGGFFFMEMNTRLQVEHPVTEMITGLDLVEWQLRIAAGEPLPFGQDQVERAGHAIEARLYAEDPARGFLPSTGRLRLLRLPPEDPHVRVDIGVREGDEVTVHYDPMIAKIIVADRDRAAAVRRLRSALARCHVVGPATNLEMLRALAAHPAFAEGAVDTGFVERHRHALVAEPAAVPDTALALAALYLLARRAAEASERAAASGDPWSPWHLTTGWRLNADNRHELRFGDGDDERTVVVHFRADGYRMEIGGRTLDVRGGLEADGGLVATVDGVRFTATVLETEGEVVVCWPGGSHRLRLPRLAGGAEGGGPVTGTVTAPMPGRVVSVAVAEGDVVAAGAPLLVLEAMKMEHTLTAPVAGRISALRCAAGEQVSEGTVLAVIEPEEG